MLLQTCASISARFSSSSLRLSMSSLSCLASANAARKVSKIPKNTSGCRLDWSSPKCPRAFLNFKTTHAGCLSPSHSSQCNSHSSVKYFQPCCYNVMIQKGGLGAQVNVKISMMQVFLWHPAESSSRTTEECWGCGERRGGYGHYHIFGLTEGFLDI